MTIYALIIAYLLGSIPFGLVLARIFKLGDLRKIGSGNIGATNVLRTGNKKVAALTLLLDLLKGSAGVFIASYVAPGSEPYAALAAVLGHVFPAWLGFKGGKGVATSFGVLLVLHPITGLIAAFVWGAVFYFTRISSLSALIALGTAPMFASFIIGPPISLIAGLVAILIFYTHRANISRLMKGEEPRFGSQG